MPEIKANDDIVQLVLDCVLKQNETILENDILVITQKIVSKAENRTVDINSITSTIEANELALSLNRLGFLLCLHLLIFHLEYRFPASH